MVLVTGVVFRVSLVWLLWADFCTGGLVFNGGFRGLATGFSVLGCCGVDSSWVWGGVGFPCWGCLCSGFALCGELGC